MAKVVLFNSVEKETLYSECSAELTNAILLYSVFLTWNQMLTILVT